MTALPCLMTPLQLHGEICTSSQSGRFQLSGTQNRFCGNVSVSHDLGKMYSYFSCFSISLNGAIQFVSKA